MDRRQFLNWVGIGMIATSLPVAIAACGSSSSDSTATDATADGGSTTVASGAGTAVGSTAQLQQDGFILDESGSSPVLVIADPNADGGVIAVNPTCTHAGCAVEWKADQTEFVCPCHDSKFDAGGAVVQGPATKPLSVYPATVEGEQILVQIS